MPFTFTISEKQTWHPPFVTHLGNKAEGPLYLGRYKSISCEEVFHNYSTHLGVTGCLKGQANIGHKG